MRRAPYPTFRPLFDRVLGAVAREDHPAIMVLQQIDRLPPAAVVDGYRRAVSLPGITPAAAAALRERLDRIGDVPAPPSTGTAPPTTPSEPSGGGGAAV